MAKNLKFHAIAIGIISAVIIVLFLFIGPKPQQDASLSPSARYIRISTATWGLSCNPQIAEAQRARESLPLAKDADGKVIQQKALKQVKINNVLPVVQQICERQQQCQVMATDDALGVQLLAGCYRQLYVNYHCAETDRLVSVSIDQGRSLKIDCSADAGTPAPHQP
jgi:hypothetical protein